MLSAALAGTFASSCATQVLDAVKDEVGLSSPKDGAEVPPSKPEQSRLTVLHRGRAHALDEPLCSVLRQNPKERCDLQADAAEHANAKPLNAMVAAVPVLSEGGLEGTQLARNLARDGCVPSDVDLVSGLHVLRVDLVGALVHRAVAMCVAVERRGRRDGLELVEVILG